MEDEGVAGLRVADQPPHMRAHVVAGGPLGRVVLVVGQHCDVLLLEAEAGLQQVLHALGVVDAAVECVVSPPAPPMMPLSTP